MFDEDAASYEIDRLRAEVEQLQGTIAKWESGEIFSKHAAQLYLKQQAEIDRLKNGLRQIESWSKGFPLDVFPEPDFARVRELLEAGGIKLDHVSASIVRKIVKVAEEISEEALKESSD